MVWTSTRGDSHQSQSQSQSQSLEDVKPSQHNTTLSNPLGFAPAPPPTAIQGSPTSQIAGNFTQKSASAHGRKPSSPIAPALGNNCMQPTFRGFIHSTRDGLTILEACLQGYLSHIPRRPHDRERQSIISSGNIFVYEENASGIRRWTDGITWSPSRIMGNFLVYRELRDGHQPGEKKRAAKKRKRGSDDLTSPQDGDSRTEDDRQLIGSLSLDAYNFKPGGLAKKTLSVELRGVKHHIISYYRVEDIKDGLYHRPAHDEFLNTFEPRRELLEHPSFKFPVEDRDDKVNVAAPPNSQLQNSHHMQMLNAGLPIVVNVSPQSTHLPQSLPPGPSIQGGPSLMYHQSASSGYGIPSGSLDPFDIDGLQQLSPDQVQQDQQTHHHQPVQQIPQQPRPQQQDLQRRHIPVSQTQQMGHHQSPNEGQAKRQRRESQRPPQHIVFVESPSYVPSSLDFGFTALPTLSAKYMDNMSQQHGFAAGGFQVPEMSHSSLYMMPQGQSYGR